MDKIKESIAKKAGKIKILLTDCDGVLTDGGVYYSETGEAMKRFSMRDGMGVERLLKLVNVETGIITGENSEIVRRRVEKLMIKEYHPGITDKLFVLNEIIRNRNLQAEQIAYIGDDVNDLEIIHHVGLSACPADAFSMIKEAAHLVMVNNGGHGAFREFAEFIIFIKKNQDEDTKKSPDR
jgi:YrbI family 3-deoxy-D-manno-octulosonate 8-phosphate phosphatase